MFALQRQGCRGWRGAACAIDKKKVAGRFLLHRSESPAIGGHAKRLTAVCVARNGTELDVAEREKSDLVPSDVGAFLAIGNKQSVARSGPLQCGYLFVSEWNGTYFSAFNFNQVQSAKSSRRVIRIGNGLAVGRPCQPAREKEQRLEVQNFLVAAI